ncbi:class I SAM-dependent methyltransferase [Corynebacterium renale]|uniref:class I SAM-dependent methyltransferase n=1 Tax=Corynebacterium renale TaxID=1724 RepID=UPI000653F706|nr:class I SAM-dependent methyltransferase [Corynebacterium renale]
MKASHWDKQAAGWAGRLEGTRDLLLEVIDEFSVLHQGASVLDIGCGPGWHLKKMAPRIAEGVGLDISSGMIAEANKSRAAHLTFHVHDWAAPLPRDIQGRKFSTVISNRNPGMNTPADLQKAVALAEEWCIISTPIARRTSLLTECLARTGQEEHGGGGRASISKLVGWALSEGFLPQLRYARRVSSRWLDRDGVRTEAQRYARRYGSSLIDVADTIFSEQQEGGRIPFELDMTFALAIWDVRETAATLDPEIQVQRKGYSSPMSAQPFFTKTPISSN